MTKLGSALLAALLVCTACAGRAGSVSAMPAVADPAGGTMLGSHIKHVVIIVQENRSFDNIFSAFPGATSATSGKTSTGETVKLHPVGFVVPQDMYHRWNSAVASWDNGKMDGFDKNIFSNTAPVKTFPYAYLTRSLVAPYWAMAQQYALADHMFPTMFGASFTGHLDLIAGMANLSPTVSEVDVPTAEPWGCDAPKGTTTWLVTELKSGQLPSPTPNGPTPCFTQFKTMAYSLDNAHVGWKYYAPLVGGADPGGLVWSEFSSIKSVRYGPDWKTNFPVPTTVLADAKAGQLPPVSWVIPDFADSDHAAARSDSGPSWVAAVVNAIGEGPDWNSTAVIVVWDDWGGWYDSVAPPQKDFRGLGLRVPCILISPYAKKGYVSHTVYEFGSVLKLVEEAFDLPVLGSESAGYTDGRAASMDDMFDFTQTPIRFKKIPSKYPASHFSTRAPSMIAPDDD